MYPYRPSGGGLLGDGCVCVVIIDGERKYLSFLGVEAHTTILSASSRTTLIQSFHNSSNTTLQDVRYNFPLFDGVSVVAFTCTIGSRVIKGVVKEKAEAKAEYNAAVRSGRKAGLFEQFDGAADVFTSSLGNIGPGEQVKVEITVLGELKHDAEIDGLRYTLPMSIAPRYSADRLLAGSSTQSLPSHKPVAMSITVDLDMASGAAIKSVQSLSHPISVSIGTTSTNQFEEPSLQRASASYSLSQAHLDKDFIIQVCASNLGAPSAVIETHPTIPNRRAVMATLVPRFNLPVDNPEVVFVCDRSGSMGQGKRISNLISALNIFLKSLPVGVLFNICSFGNKHDFLWPKSQSYDQKTLEQAIDHVNSFQANYGGTEMLEAIRDTFRQRDSSRNLEVFLMTDGEIWNQQDVFDMINTSVSDSKRAIRLFSLGVGHDVSHALIEGVARAGQGFSQTVAEDEKMDKKVVRMLKGALTPHVYDYTVEITYDKADDEEFELVEKLDECLTVGAAEATTHGSTTEADTGPSKPKPISLHDPSVKDEDLQMPSHDAAQHSTVPDLGAPKYLQAPSTIPPMFPFSRTNVYILLSETGLSRQPKSVVIKGSSSSGPLVLEMPVAALEDKGTTVHQLAAKKAIQDLEEGRGWIYRANSRNGKPIKDEYAMKILDIAKAEAVKLGLEYQVAGKWCSFVAVEKDSGGNDNPIEKGEEAFEIISQTGKGGAPGGQQHGMQFARMRMAAAPAMASMNMSYLPKADMSSTTTRLNRAALQESLQQRQHQQRPHQPQEPVKASLRQLDLCQGRTVEMPSCQEDTEDDFDAEEEYEDEDLALFEVAPSSPKRSLSKRKRSKPSGNTVEQLIKLQNFAGNWNWSVELESLLGITKSQVASVKLPLSVANPDDLIATLCVVVYMKKKQVDEKDVWELVVEKAEAWISSQGRIATSDVEKDIEVLF